MTPSASLPIPIACSPKPPTPIAQAAAGPPATTDPAPSPAYTELSDAITRALTLTQEAGCALTTAGQALIGLSGALAEVVTAVAATRRWPPPPPQVGSTRALWSTSPRSRRCPDQIGPANPG
ncbi:MAG: hypothetical protein ACT4NY_12760 [Pseudonocardiales bacterium]